jgi:serine/threonine-protein kinase
MLTPVQRCTSRHRGQHDDLAPDSRAGVSSFEAKGEQSSLTATPWQSLIRDGCVARLIGRKINNFVIRSRLGEGGMGTVYLAEHPMFNRRVAVKILKRHFSEDAVLVERFRNEARAANAIEHPNIVEMLDMGTLDDGLPYLVMELLEGEPLSKRIGRGRLPLHEALEIASQTASAVGAAHEKAIVHRDLKPDNLFLVEGRGKLQVKVLDFGIAKLKTEISGGQLNTKDGVLMGTPPYMSPEQCVGLMDRVDHRTDIYTLGIILYEMLTGAPPFQSTGYGPVIAMHLNEPPRPPSQLNPAIPAQVEAIILKALAKKPDERFATMEEMQAALASAATQAPVELPRTEVLPIAPPPIGADPPARTQLLPPSDGPQTTLTGHTGTLEGEAERKKRTRRAIAVGGGAALFVIVAALFKLILSGGTEPRRVAAADAAPLVAARAPADPAPAVTAPATVDAGAPDVRGGVDARRKGTHRRGKKEYMKTW